MAVFPVPGGPAIRIARPAILPSLTIFRIKPAAFRAFTCPTMPCDTGRGSSASSRPSPRMCEWEPVARRRAQLLGTSSLPPGATRRSCANIKALRSARTQGQHGQYQSARLCSRP
ncbi:MAG: hypothetical protein BJ554DRAFT_983 [Olpidium bornovanus]|uniref:Uncharacterized protein n=1 Tax=Olpidium bornovanus TaxID=278681 RepID=A0A8H7ZSZ3_9FUNG|nr:MAG: hypothetical protein BJ554DRAFT_983 [Olpidium bornovanus]